MPQATPVPAVVIPDECWHDAGHRNVMAISLRLLWRRRRVMCWGATVIFDSLLMHVVFGFGPLFEPSLSFPTAIR